MQYTKGKQLATGMLVALLLLSGIMIFPSATVEASSTAPISLNVVDNTNAPVAGATATLTETHTSKMYSTSSDAGGLATFSPPPGYYILRISKSGYYDLEYSTVVKYDGINAVQLGLIQINKLPTTVGTLTVTVTSGGSPVSGVTLKTIDLNSPTKMEKIYSFSGSTSQIVHTSTYRLVTSANGFETDVRDVTVSSGVTVNVNVVLNPSVTVTGYVYKNNVPASGVTAVLVSSNPSLPVEKRIITGRVTSNYFVIDGFADSNPFYLMVDATDAQASMQSITLITSQTVTINLVSQGAQVDSNGIVFASNDWNNFNLYRNLTMDFDASWPNIPYSYLPNLRMQIDFAFGDGNGVVSATEYNAFINRVRSFGPLNVTSDFMVRVNGTKYTVQTDFVSAAFTGISGSSVTSTAQYSAAFVSSYRSQANILNGGSTYTVTAYARYDTNSLNNIVYLTWPRGNEMTANTTSTGSAVVTGYLSVTIDPTVRTTGTHEVVTMTIQRSVAPIATAGIDVSSDWAYAVTSGTSVLYYIVNSQKPIVFTANGSSDPNGNPLKFTWNFGNGVVQGPISSYWTTYTYGAAHFNLTVTLTVTDVAGLTAVKSFYVKSDGINPTPDFKVKDHTLSLQAPNLIVKQNEALIFNGATSYDHIASTASNDVGIIKRWEYIWGDGNKTVVGMGENQNVTKTYARAGTFTMVLNVTDVAGRVSTKSIIVLVKDTVPPVVSFTIELNGNSVTTAQENQTLVFNGNATYDANDSFDKLSFSWTFGDSNVATGPWVRHAFSAIKTFTVKLEVTDQAGNKANLTKSIVITSSPRPDLRIVSMIFDPNPMTEGSAGTIKVNLTNVGSSNALAPKVEFFILSSSGSKSKIGESSNMRVNDVTNSTLMPGKFGLIYFSWTPSAKGNFTIVATASVDNEIVTTDNSYTAAITVNEAAWKAIALYGGIFAAIVVVILLYFYRKRLPKLGGKKEKQKEETKKQPATNEEKKGKK
ncbi:MAG: PKD domain-containing protein [Methanomassiliicoccales archaeon]